MAVTEGCGTLPGLYRCGLSVCCRRVRRGDACTAPAGAFRRPTRPQGPALRPEIVPQTMRWDAALQGAADATGRFVGRAISPAAAGDGLHGDPVPGQGRAVSPQERKLPRRVPAAGVNARPTAGTASLPDRQGRRPCKGQGVKGSNQSSRRLRRKMKHPAAATTTSRT